MDIRLDFISAETLASKSRMDKINLILERIRSNVILILEEALDPKEEAELIEATMREVDSEKFYGIEFYRIDHQDNLREKIASYISGRKSGLTIVGPTKLVEAIKKEPDHVSMLARLELPEKEKEEEENAP